MVLQYNIHILCLTLTWLLLIYYLYRWYSVREIKGENIKNTSYSFIAKMEKSFNIAFKG